MSVFVTVGTTSFDDLVQEIFTSDVLKRFEDLGYSKLTVQYGRGKFVPTLDNDFITLEAFDFQSSIQPYMQKADLIISHAGAGSCLEALAAKKKLIVVVNEKLMDNHQLELAHQLYKDRHLLYCNVKSLGETLQKITEAEFLPFPVAQTTKFRDYLDQHFGLNP